MKTFAALPESVVLIVGLGLIGGSVAKAIKANQICHRVIACDCDEQALKLAKVKEIIDNIVNFLTPIQSGFNLIKAFFTGELDEKELDADKKRVDDALEDINGKGGLIDQLAEKAGPLGGLIKTLKPAIELVRGVIGGKKWFSQKKVGRKEF